MDHTIEVPIGTLLRYERERRHLTQQVVGDAIGVTKEAVSLWETGVTEPNPRNRAALRSWLDETAP
ncbi:MAG TPA: helix-turn-helix transcriptional regulator [Mycobacteriales bacterium]